jgi:uncharacterized OB-fold protein
MAKSDEDGAAPFFGAELFDAAAQGTLLLPRCKACGRAHWYPRPVCPFCFGTDIEWMTASGRGTIYSFSAMKAGDETYTIAYVKLPEGPTMLTNLVDCDEKDLAIGGDVRVAFRRAEHSLRPMPFFIPAPR